MSVDERDPHSLATHLESAIDGTRLPAGTVQTLHESRPLWVRYDLPTIATPVDCSLL